MEFKGLTLDKFQEDAVAAIDRGESCVVSASTGTGKTLIAEYIIHTHLPEGNTVIYTAPIKALSNQKYMDFCSDYGKEKVGLLTGDHNINPEAPILLMTTEIYRNMLLTNDPVLDRVSYVIFDEIHYINDLIRGTVWEESVIFSPDHVRFLALSATIPNYKEFADWISKVKNHKVTTVFYGHRPVPLKHIVYDKRLGLTTIEKVQVDMLKDEALHEGPSGARKPKSKTGKPKSKKHIHTLKPPYHLEVIPEVDDKTPIMYFCFSRKKCQEFALELAKEKNYSSTEEHKEITAFVREHVTSEIAQMDTTKLLRNTIAKGIAFHHSGMLPALKHIVEQLFGRGLIKVLYTTETFSVGINMPAKVVVFNTLDKYDGVSLRMLNAKEYFQIAGRAGRRGIDKEGTVVSLINRKFTNLKKLQKISTVDDEPIISAFTLSMNTVLNLVHNFSDEKIETILKSSFDYYLKTKQGKKVHIMQSYNNKIKTLKKLGFIKSYEDDQSHNSHVEYDRKHYLTPKGLFARHLYSNEVVLTELFHLPFLDKFDDVELLTLLASIVYEERRLDYFMIKGTEKHYRRLVKRLEDTRVYKDINKIHLKRMINFVHKWATGGKFLDLMQLSNLAEGDIIRFFRRLIDTLTQLQHATPDEHLRNRMGRMIELIDRDLVSADI